MPKAFYASPEDLIKRIPELQSLRTKSIALFGLGSLGAPSALEFARAGIGQIRLVDFDRVDPATVVRWPLGLPVSGNFKTEAIANFVRLHYPYVDCKETVYRLGSVRDPNLDNSSDQEVIAQVTENIDLIYDCTAELGVNHYLSDFAWLHGISYIGVSGTYGGWGGKVFRIRPQDGRGCWNCYVNSCSDKIIPEPPSLPVEEGEVQPTGCADPTFTGAGFDMLQVALMGVRTAVSTLCEGTDGAYPPWEKDIVHIHLRSDEGALITPLFIEYENSLHPKCKINHDGKK